MTPRAVLITDDDRLLRETLCEAFEPLGWVTRQAGDGQGAIRMLRQSPCDLLLSDIDMPGMSGFELLGWVREHPPRPQVILMSARADDDLGRSALASGAVALLPKPVEITVVTGLVHRLFPDH